MESATFTVNVLVPTVVGVPEINPAVDKDNPDGRFSDAKVNVYGAVPPDADSTGDEYDCP